MLARRGIFVFLAALLLSPLAQAQDTFGDRNRTFPLNAPADFDVGGAMTSLYGNYDPKIAVSITPTPDDLGDDSSFGTSGHIRVRPFFAASVNEGGVNKVFLLTYATPLEREPGFDCHACVPLISAFEFSLDKGRFTLTASSKNTLFLGAWGYPPRGSTLRIGPSRYAIKLEDLDGGQGYHSLVIALFVPWQGTFDAVLKRWMGDDDSGDCPPPEGNSPCYANHKRIEMAKGLNPDYYDIMLTLSGTEGTENPPYRIRRVSGVERLRFIDGKYESLFRTGDTTDNEREVLKSPFYK
jgi:hypothetical protein